MSPSSFFSLFIQLQIHLLVIHPAVSLHMPQFTWTGPLSLHAQLDPSTEDTIILQHANTVPGVVVTCLFQGIFQREINGSAVISGCRASPVVHVTIISRYLRGRTMFEIRDNLTQEVVSAYSGNQNLENEDEVSRFRRSLFPGDEMAQYDYLDYSDPMPTDLVLKMKFAYDESFKRHLGSDAAARKYIAEVVTHGKEYFKEESLGTNIFLDIQGPPQLLPNKELDISGPSFVQVQEVKVEEPIPLSVFCYTDDEDSLMGVSKRGKACDANLGISLTKWRCNVLKAAQTFAHESGHMDGFFHDAWEDAVNEANGITSNCEGNGLMSDDTPFEERPNAWSICTSQRFAKWFRRFGKECIAEVIPCNEGSGSWRTPCKCGSGPAPSLCVEGHTCCQHQTATCLGEPSDIVKLYAIIQSMKLEMESLRRDIGGNDAGITTALAKATKLENCLTDVTSSDCPSSAYGKTAMSAAITANADGLKAIADGVKTNSDGVKANAEGVKANADGVKTNANEVKANTDKISSHNAALATKCDTSTCTNIETTATKIENCLTDVKSSDCPSSAYGKTAMSAAITANADGLKAIADGVKTNADGVKANAEGVKANADGVKANTETSATKIGILYFQKEETKLKQGIRLATLPIIRKEYLVNIDFRENTFVSQLQSIFHFTVFDRNTGNHGGRIPTLWINSSRTFQVGASIGGTNKEFTFGSTIPTNKWINIQISQKLVNGGYMFAVLVDGQQKYSKVNNNPQEFTNVIVYAPNPGWHATLKGSIRNFYIRQ